MSTRTVIRKDLVGYFLSFFSLFLGFFIFLLQGEWSWLRYISLFPLTFGFIALGCQLSEDNNNKAAVFSVGLNFLVWFYVFRHVEILLGQLFLVTLLAIALAIFTLSILMSFKSSKAKTTNFHVQGIGFYVFMFVEFIVALGSLFSFIKNIFQLIDL